MNQQWKTLFGAIVGLAVCAMGAELSGLDIVQKAYDADKGKSSKSTVKMTLVDKRGKERHRRIVSLRKDFGKVEKTVMTFKKPADVAGTSFLNWSYDDADKDDDQWIYFPSLGKVRRISSSAKGDYFMGTEFTYDDMGSREPAEDAHTLEAEEDVGGRTCYRIVSIPRDEDYMYGKKVSWIGKECLLPIKVEYYDEDKELLKVLTNRGIDKIDGIWTITGMDMENVQKNRSTLLRFEKVEYNIAVPDRMFTQRTLTRGGIK